MADSNRDNASGVRRLGFGVSGPHGSPLVRPEATVAMIMQAFALGVRVFDTAPAYGNGEAERRLGEALARLPPYEPIVSTKVGLKTSGLMKRAQEFDPESVRKSIEGSLQRLRRSRVDWLFLHGPPPEALTDALLKTLVDLKFKGDIGEIGICARDHALDAALTTGQFSLFMTPVHIGLEPHELTRLERLRAAGELIGIETLAPAKRRFPAPVSAGATWQLARSLLGRGGPVPPTPMTVEEALNWALNEGGAHRAIMTTSRLDHLETNVYAVSNPVSGRLISG
ncbi:MAG: aldo/keto reductase [Hyphomonadaceae bacterium]|nr:aldo/keto reductase [Hyphomonadaceae bacterium]